MAKKSFHDNIQIFILLNHFFAKHEQAKRFELEGIRLRIADVSDTKPFNYYLNTCFSPQETIFGSKTKLNKFTNFLVHYTARYGFRDTVVSRATS